MQHASQFAGTVGTLAVSGWATHAANGKALPLRDLGTYYIVLFGS